ncbi:MAG: SH3 domain-containing protein [Chloroflexi bacterium]|nr:SH3 domain-containing protein [Chloroflexota bacterium]
MGRYRSARSRSPSPLAFLIAIAIVFGAYYLFTGFQTYLRTGGLGVEEATRQAEVIASATADRVTRALPVAQMTLRPTATPPPTCQDFRVSVPAGIVRETPSTSGTVVTQFTQGTVVCVLGREANSEWYTIDLNPNTRRIDLAYMHETVIEAVNPTPTATQTLPATATPVPVSPTLSPSSAASTATPETDPGLVLPTMPPAPRDATRPPAQETPPPLATVTLTPAS